LPLNGLSYDRKADAFYVYVESIDRPATRSFIHARSLSAGGRGWSRSGERFHGDKHFIRLRQPLAPAGWLIRDGSYRKTSRAL
jgi:hypothetical protein